MFKAPYTLRKKENNLFDFIESLIGSSFEQLFPFLAIVVPVIILAVYALRIPDYFSGSPPDTGQDSEDTKVAAPMKQTAAVLFIDLRGFHKLSEGKSPEETVSILNHFFEAVGVAVTSVDGWIDNYMGDGMLIVFGHKSDPQKGCQQAIKALQLIRDGIKKLNRKLSAKLHSSLQIGIGLHVGPLLIARLGHRNTLAKRVVGPTVNTAIRLEELTKERDVQVIMSIDVARCAGISGESINSEYVVLRDNNIPLEVLLFSTSETFPEIS